MIVFRFRLINKDNTRSWVESFYREGTITVDDPAIRARCVQWATKRAALLSKDNVILDCTVSSVDISVRVSHRYSLNTPGSAFQGWFGPGLAQVSQDVAPVAFLLNLQTATRIRRFLMRGAPDSQFTAGAFTPEAAFVNSLRVFRTEMLDGWGLRATGNNAWPSPSNVITSVDAEGVTMNVPLTLPLAAGSMVSVTTRVTGGGPRVAKVLRTTTVAPAGTSRIPLEWTAGSCTGGVIQDKNTALSVITHTGYTGEGRTRKTGRPFSAFSGRRSRK